MSFFVFRSSGFRLNEIHRFKNNVSAIIGKVQFHSYLSKYCIFHFLISGMAKAQALKRKAYPSQAPAPI